MLTHVNTALTRYEAFLIVLPAGKGRGAHLFARTRAAHAADRRERHRDRVFTVYRSGLTSFAAFRRLLHEAYDPRWEEDAAAPLGFYIHRDNRRWEAEDFTGELEMHTSVREPGGGGIWYSYLIEFAQGKVVGLQHGPGHGVPLPTRRA